MNWTMFADYIAVVVMVYLMTLTLWRFITAKTYHNTFSPYEVLIMSAAIAFLAVS